jgi:hypothetical protein
VQESRGQAKNKSNNAGKHLSPKAFSIGFGRWHSRPLKHVIKSLPAPSKNSKEASRTMAADFYAKVKYHLIEVLILIIFIVDIAVFLQWFLKKMGIL